MRFKTPADETRFGTDFRGTLTAQIARANAGSVRGGSNIVVIFDELAHFIGNDGRHSDTQIYTALTPSTSRFRNEGKKISISSPLNRSGKLWDLYNRSFNDEANFNMLMLQIPTWEINESVDPDFLKGEYADNPRAYICEYGAQFSDQISAWVDRDKFLFCVKDYLEEKAVGVPGQNYYVGIDLGLKRDGTGISVVHPEIVADPLRPGEYKTVYILDYSVNYRPGEGKYQHKSPLSLEDMADEVLNIFNRFNIKKGVFDQWAGTPFEEALRRRGITRIEQVSFTDTINSDVYRVLEILYLQDNVWLYEHEELIKEVLRLQAQQRTKYKTIVEAPNVADAHDDISDSFARAVWCAFTSHKTGQRFTIGSNARTGQVNTGYSETGGNYHTFHKRKSVQHGFDNRRDLRMYRGGGRRR